MRASPTIALLVAAAWTARRGEIRALVAAVTVGVTVAIACLFEYFVPGSVAAGPFVWVGFWEDFGLRLDRTIATPKALSAQLIVPTMLLPAAALFARGLRLRRVAIRASLPLIAAHYLTLNRSAILGLYVFVVVRDRSPAPSIERRRGGRDSQVRIGGSTTGYVAELGAVDRIRLDEDACETELR